MVYSQAIFWSDWLQRAKGAQNSAYSSTTLHLFLPHAQQAVEVWANAQKQNFKTDFRFKNDSSLYFYLFACSPLLFFLNFSCPLPFLPSIDCVDFILVWQDFSPLHRGQLKRYLGRGFTWTAVLEMEKHTIFSVSNLLVWLHDTRLSLTLK